MVCQVPPGLTILGCVTDRCIFDWPKWRPGLLVHRRPPLLEGQVRGAGAVANPGIRRIASPVYLGRGLVRKIGTGPQDPQRRYFEADVGLV